MRQLGEKKFSIVLTQGYNRQIRRMCRALGYGVNAIRRVRIMNLTLGDLKQGEYRFLTRTEVAELEHDLEKPEKSTRTGMYLGSRGEKLHTSEGDHRGHGGRPHVSGNRRRDSSLGSREKGHASYGAGKSVHVDRAGKNKSSFGSRKRLEEGRKRNGNNRRGDSYGGRSNFRK